MKMKLQPPTKGVLASYLTVGLLFSAQSAVTAEDKQAPVKNDLLNVIGLDEKHVNSIKTPDSAKEPNSRTDKPVITTPGSIVPQNAPSAQPLPNDPKAGKPQTNVADPEVEKAMKDAKVLLGAPTEPATKIPFNTEQPAAGALEMSHTREDRVRQAKKLTDLDIEDFSMRRISLLDAVRLTLANSPAIQLAVQDVSQAQASLLGIQGSFDHNLGLNYDYGNKVSELKDTEKARELARYQTMRELYSTAQTVLKRIDDVVSGKLPADELSLDGTPLGDPTSFFNGGQGPDATKDDQAIAQYEKFRDAQTDALIVLLQGGLNIPDTKEAQDLAYQAALAQREIFIKMRNGAKHALEREPPWMVTRTETQRYELSILRRFRGGPSVKLFAKANSTETNFQTRSHDPRENRSAVGLQVSFNLAKLGLADPIFAQERALAQDVSAKQELARDKAGAQVLSTVQAYWQLAAAQERLERLYLSELETLASTTLAQRMIDGNLLPQAEKAQIDARQLQAVAARMSAEIELATAQQALALTMGLDPASVYAAPLASDPLPTVTDVAILKELGASALVQHTLAYHPNLVAFRYLTNASLILQDQARRDLRPDFRISLGGDFSGYNQGSGLDGTFGVMGSSQTGASFLVAGSIDWPFENRTRRGNYFAAETATRQTRLREDTARRQLATNVSLAYRKVLASSEQGAKLATASKKFAEGLQVERQKLQSGTGTANDIIFAEQNLTNALLQEITSRFVHATSLAELRYNSFTILPPFEFNRLESGSANMRITDEYFTSIPTRLVLSQYRGSAPSVTKAAVDAANLEKTMGMKKPEPLLKRIFGRPDDRPLKESYPASSSLDAKHVHVPKTSAQKSSPASAGVGVKSSPAPAKAISTKTMETPPAADTGSRAPQKPKPLLRKLFGGD
jgi:outer membrane protein TolC